MIAHQKHLAPNLVSREFKNNSKIRNKCFIETLRENTFQGIPSFLEDPDIIVLVYFWLATCRLRECKLVKFFCVLKKSWRLASSQITHATVLESFDAVAEIISQRKQLSGSANVFKKWCDKVHSHISRCEIVLGLDALQLFVVFVLHAFKGFLCLEN